MSLTEVTGAQLAREAGTTRQAVYKAGLRKTDSGQYDMADPEVKAWVEGRKRAQRRQRDKTGDASDQSIPDLEKQELEWKIEYLKERTRERQLKNAETSKDLIPFQLFEMALGAFASGIRTNVLTIGNKIARGDVELRDKIEAATKVAIERTVEGAQRQITEMIDQEIEQLTEQIEEADDDDEK